MKSRGVQHDPLSDIANIRNTLKGYGAGFTIIKELVQNAEDAGASLIRIGWHPGFPTCETAHPLLQGPAFCMVNDGPFKKEHEEAICRMGLGSKGAEEHSIGRFGLGLKSVFHLCEAFFFLASGEETGETVRLTELFNPWHGGHHAEWETDQPDDQIILENALSGLLPEKHWFALWLPLRRERICNKVAPIIENFPGDKDSPQKDIKDFFSTELNDVLPLLSSLREIGFLVCENEKWITHYRTEITSDSVTRKRLDSERRISRDLNGIVERFFNTNEPTLLTKYIGRENWLGDAIFKDLKNNAAWPKVVVADEDGFDPGKKEKALPHFCNYFTCRDKTTDRAKFRIKWAVFLPVGDDLYNEVEIPNFSHDITLILHGYFFLNSERTSIDGLESNFSKSNKIYVEWNKRLASQGNLRHVLPLFEQFVYREEFSDSDIQLITNALVESKIFRNFKKEICSHNQWIYKLSNNSVKWCCIPYGDAVYTLPSPLQLIDHLPYDVFPDLESLTKKYHICFTDDISSNPKLVSSSEYEQWSETMLESLYAKINIASLHKQSASSYLLKVIRSHSLLSEKLWRILGNIPLFKTRSNQTGIEKKHSLDELEEHKQAGGLFSYTRGERLEIILQSVCPHLKVTILINDELESEFLPKTLRELSELDINLCAKSILSSKRLGGIESRISAVKYFIRNTPQYTVDTKFKNTIRYLLHGDYSNQDNSKTLYISSTDHAGSSTWNKIIKIVLSKIEGLWRIIDDEFEQDLTRNELNIYGIKKITVETIYELLSGADVAKLDFNTLDTSDRKEIFLHLQDNDLIKRLPIHETAGGGFGPVTELSYLENDFEIEPNVQDLWQELLSRANVIKRFDDLIIQTRQKDILSELDWNAAIELALKSPNPAKYARVVMAGLRSLGTPRQPTGDLLKQAKWLPLKTNHKIPPKNVIHIEEAAEEIHRLLNQEKDGLCGVLALADWISLHPGLNALKQQFLTKKESLEYLGLWLSGRENMSVGLERIESPEELRELIEIFADCPVDVMALQPFLSNLESNTELLQLGFQYFLPNVQEKIVSERIIKILNFLCSSHQESTAENKRKVLKWFNRYLKQAVKYGYNDIVIQEIKLINQREEWLPTSKLTWPSEGIALRHQVNKEQAQILSDQCERPKISTAPSIVENPQRSIDGEDLVDLETSSDLLIEYFEKIEGTGIPREMIGAIGAVLGNYGPIKKWADKMLGDQSIDTIRAEMLPGIVLSHPSFDLKRFVVKMIVGDTAYATSLTSEPFRVDVSENPESFLFGDAKDMWWSIPNHPEVKGNNCHQIKLLSIEDVQDVPLEEVAKLLRKTADLIITNVYCNGNAIARPDPKQLWSNLSETGQRNIITAQLYLLNAGDFYIKQLGSDHHSLIRTNLKQWERARQYKVDSELLPNQKESLLRKSEESEREARDELRDLLISNNEVHEVFVKAFREKMRNYQYDISSIPFELFQNADDAYQELVNMGCELEANNHQKPFIICVDENSLQFVHWGRCINEHYRQGSFDRGKELGFDRDLQKMLTLSSSDKGIRRSSDDQSSSRDVTGKFGLGFKSVFFTTSSPRVLSGRLSFHIRGGFYPQQLDRKIKSFLQDRLNNFRPGQQYKGTIFDLPFDRKQSEKPEQILSRFQGMASLQVVFSKQIKKCEIRSATQKVLSFSWQEQRVSGTQSFFVGKLSSEKLGGYRYALVLRPPKGDRKLKECSLLFPLNFNGFTKLADEMPSIWITAPTQEENAVGFAVNGPFEPDVGRSVLARNSDNNRNLVNDLTLSMGESWIDFYENAQKGWDDIELDLRLAHDCTQKGFWESLWRLMANNKLLSLKDEPEGTAANFLYTLTWGYPEGGYRKLLNSCPVIPSKLMGRYDMLLFLPDIDYIVIGMLDQKTKIFEKVSQWPSFQEKIGAASVASGNQIGSVLKKHAEAEFAEVEDVDFRKVISWELEGDEVSPENARRIGLLIDKGFERATTSSEYSNEYFQLQNRYKRFKFKSEIDDYTLVKKLISSKEVTDYITKDEAMRAAFAPDDVILSQKYDDNAIQFFAICRGNMDAPSDTLAKWVRVLSKEQEAPRRAALLYLSQGELGEKVAEHLRNGGINNTWLANLNKDSTYFEGWDDYAIDELLRRKLSSIETLRKIDLPPSVNDFIAPVPNPSKSLSNIFDWWQENDTEYINDYEESIYPGGKLPNLKDDDFGDFDRSEWLTMLLIGAFHTLGRTKPEQHRGFIALCRNNGWWDTFSAKKQLPDEWMKVLDQYINDQVDDTQYEHWMNRFPTIYRLARKLDDYANAFYELDKQGENVNVEQTLRPRIFEVFQGGGIDAAPIAKTLGMGSCFVLREMMRGNLLKNKHVIPYCYVPVKKVRDLMVRFRCNGINDNESYMSLSKIIYDFLCEHLGADKAKFHGSFDIALQFVAQDRELQNYLFE